MSELVYGIHRRTATYEGEVLANAAADVVLAG